MDSEFFQDKIIKLSDEKLVELLRTTNNEFNKEVFQWAKEEATKRNLTFDSTKPVVANNEADYQNDPELLKKWNWGACMFAPLWALVYTFDKVAVLSFIPIIGNIYFGLMGNRLGFQKNGTLSITEFLTLQKKWNYWGKVYFWFLVVSIGLLAILVDGPEPLYHKGEQPFKN